MGGNIKANRRLAEHAGLTAPRPPPDTDRNFVERYIVRKYRGTTFFDSYHCQEASRALARELAEEVERRRLAKEKVEREAAERARREREEQLERERREREAREAAERVRKEQEAERVRQQQAEWIAAANAEREARERAAAASVAAANAASPAPSAAGALPVGGFRDAVPSPVPVPNALPYAPSHVLAGHDPAGSLAGLVVVDVVSVSLFKERVLDLRFMGAWFLNLSVVVSLGKVSAVPTASRKGSASVRWEPPEQREMRWDCKQRWLWCRVNDNLNGGSTQLAGVGVVDVRAAEAEAVDNGTGVKAAEMELELLAKEPASQPKMGDLLFMTACQAKPALMEDDLVEDDEPGNGAEGMPPLSRKANAKCWQIPAGSHGAPGPPGAHGHYMFEQVEDLDHLRHGQTCGTVILRLTVLDPTSQPLAPSAPAAYVV